MDTANHRIFIGRQGIYDAKGELYGYELLYRDSHTSSARFSDADKASSDVLLNTFIEIGIEQLTGPHKAFINLTRKLMLDLPPLPFEEGKVVLELHEDVEVDDALIEAIRRYRENGQAVALDDYAFEDKWQPLLPHLTLIKLDLAQLDIDTLSAKIDDLSQYPAKLVAEKVETAEQFEQLKAMDIDFFQGYFFSRPRVIESRTIGENDLVILRLLTRLNDPDVAIEELDELIAQDPALSYKILRYINSAAIGLRRKVDSIRQAVVYLGLKRIKAWVTLLTMSGLQSGNKDALLNAIVRAYMCQALAKKAGINPDTAFTVGSLSILDTLMQAPMATILQNLPLTDEITNALLNREGPLGDALNCALAYETLDWQDVQFPGCDEDCLNEAFLNSSHEAFRAVMGLEDED